MSLGSPLYQQGETNELIVNWARNQTPQPQPTISLAYGVFSIGLWQLDDGLPLHRELKSCMYHPAGQHTGQLFIPSTGHWDLAATDQYPTPPMSRTYKIMCAVQLGSIWAFDRLWVATRAKFKVS